MKHTPNAVVIPPAARRYILRSARWSIILNVINPGVRTPSPLNDRLTKLPDGRRFLETARRGVEEGAILRTPAIEAYGLALGAKA